MVIIDPASKGDKVLTGGFVLVSLSGVDKSLTIAIKPHRTDARGMFSRLGQVNRLWGWPPVINNAGMPLPNHLNTRELLRGELFVVGEDEV